jgi:putative Mg2+ transporter-C (MgtC) family protein
MMDAMEKEMFIRLGVAILLGAIVGAEREYHSKSAGFRTMMLISLGACLFTMLSIAIGAPGNPDRIASNIATGIGFLGAGVIFRGDNRVNGITTAATIWAMAAIGVAVGSGHIILAVWTSLGIVTVLALLPYVQNWIDKINQERFYTITISDEMEIKEIEQLFRAQQLACYRVSFTRHDGRLTIEWRAHGPEEAHNRFVEAMLQNEQVLRFVS